MKKVFFLICCCFLCSLISWGQTWNLTPTMTVKLDNDGVMTVSTSKTSEEMPDFTNSDDVPWKADRSKILTIIIENNVSSIGKIVFSSSIYLTKVKIASTVKSIGAMSFALCFRLKHVEVEWTIPLALDPYVFLVPLSPVTLSDMTLHVPTGTKSNYQNAATWKDFGTIVEYNPTGNDRIDNLSLKSYSSNGILNIVGLQPGKQFSVYSISGQAIYRGIAKAETEQMSLNQGIYVVAANNQAIKVIVK